MGRGKEYLILLFILIINVIVFSPSFNHPARGDQWYYLIETADIDDLGGLVNYSYSYTRSRVIFQGDEMLFRPLFCTILAFERWAFGFHFVYWQMTSFFLHLVVLIQLWKVLRLFIPAGWAGLVVLNFSVLHLSQEMVIWHHINPYGGVDPGLEATLKTVREVHTTFLKGVTDTPEDIQIRFASRDVALATVVSDVSAFTGPDGVAQAPHKNVRTFVVVRRGDRWLIMQDHNTNVASPPG